MPGESGDPSTPVVSRRRLTRRGLLVGAGALGAGAVGARLLAPRFLRPGPVRPVEELSDGARALVTAAFDGVEPSGMWDLHAHLIGLGRGSHATWVAPRMRSHAHPVERLKFDVYLASAGVTDLDRADEQYRERLLALHRAANPAGRLVLLAFDQHVTEAGEVDLAASTFHTPDDAVLELAREHPDVEACVSVHPYRGDALERLDRAAAAGALAVKWLPNAMGMDPASALCDAFYERMAAHDLVLLSHTGIEHAVHSERAQSLGNPLRLRRALDRGVRVVALHCASLGEQADLDAPRRPKVPAFELFLRLMGEPAYEGRLFGGISAVTLINRKGNVLPELLRAQELHARLVNGSDYPIPAVDPLIRTRQLVERGVLDAEDRGPLRELFEANPLLFDFVLKRRVRVLAGAERLGFQPILFDSARLFRA